MGDNEFVYVYKYEGKFPNEKHIITFDRSREKHSIVYVTVHDGIIPPKKYTTLKVRRSVVDELNKELIYQHRHGKYVIAELPENVIKSN